MLYDRQNQDYRLGEDNASGHTAQPADSTGASLDGSSGSFNSSRYQTVVIDPSSSSGPVRCAAADDVAGQQAGAEEDQHQRRGYSGTQRLGW